MSPFVCNYPWTHFEVNNPNGDVTMCCDNSSVLGNINEHTVEEIWNNKSFQKARKQMRDGGALSMCPATCPVIHGFKTHQNLDWYREMSEGAAKSNAILNEKEFETGACVLKSRPRWMRYTYSYKCNLDCYHCYQREDATENVKLPDSFMQQVYELSPYYQVLFFFGGEPFLYKPVTEMIENIKVDPEGRLFLISNGTLLTEKTFAALEKKNIGMFAVSLDAADKTTFDNLRVRGRTASWDSVMDNLGRIAELHKRKPFFFEISMTVNSRNYDQIKAFVDMGVALGAEPLLLLVSNPFQTSAFQREFLHFSEAQFTEMKAQIVQSLETVRAAGKIMLFYIDVRR